ncbi:MAG: PAS domain S-box protein [Polyangiales bacterium]
MMEQAGSSSDRKRKDAGTREAIAMALLAAAVGVAAFSSWHLGLPFFRDFGIGKARTSALTGIALLVAGASTVAAHRGARRVPRVGGAIVAAIGAIVLVEWLFGVAGGLAHLLIPPADRQPFAGRMSVPAAVVFLLLGPALMFVRRGRSALRRPSDYLAALAAFCAFAVLTAYAYGATSFMPVLGAPDTGMAFPTGLALFALSISMLLVDARHGLGSIFFAKEPGGQLARRVVLIVALFPPILGVLVTAGRAIGLRDTPAQFAVLTVVASAMAVSALVFSAHQMNLAAAQRIRAEEDLRIAKARLRGLITNAPDALLAVDERGVVVIANDRATALFGRDLVDTPLETVLPGVFERACVGGRLRMELEVHTVRGAVPIEITCSHVLTGPARTTLILRDVSERKLAEEMLCAKEARLRMLFEHATDGIFFTTPDGVYTEVNDAGCRMLGVTRDQIVGKRIVDFLPAEELPRFLANREQILAGATIEVDVRMRKGDGSLVDVEIATGLLPDGRWLALTRDVTQRKIDEEQLRRAHEREQRLRRQIEAISEATAAVAEAVTRLPQSNLREILHTVVVQAQAITGARYGALGIGGDAEHACDEWAAAGFPDEAVRAIGRNPKFRGLLAAAANQNGLRIDDLPHVVGSVGFPPGHPSFNTLLAVPIRYRDQLLGVLYLADKTDGTTFTVEDQRALEILAERVAIKLETARLYEAEARERSWLQVTIDQMPEAVLLADASGRVTSWNRAASAIARQGLATDGGRPFELRWPSGEPVSEADDPIHRACIGGELVSGVELIVIARDGRRVPVLASASPLPHDELGAHGAVAILQDVTHQKELEHLREEWTAIVAHDLRQPVASIAMAAQLLQRRMLDREDAKLVNRIHSGADRLRRMIDDLLDYAQIEAGRLRITPRPIDLEPLVAEVIDRLAPSTQGHPVRLVTDHVDTRAYADPGRIDQVITNLVSNAVKYGDAGTAVVVTIGGGAGEVEIAVENRGPGMSRDELDHLFARFGRMPSAEAMGVKGVGLGLFITKGIVEAHGGRIWAESTPSETTTFHVVLPAMPRRHAA